MRAGGGSDYVVDFQDGVDRLDLRSYTGANIASIAKIQLQILTKRLAHMDLALEVSDAAVAELAKVGFDPVFGARPLKRAIQQRLENPLSKLLLEGRFPPKSGIEVSVDPVRHPGQFDFKVINAAA